MKSLFCRLAGSLCYLVSAFSSGWGQYVPDLERGDTTSRLQSDIEANRVHVSVGNFGLIGRTGAGQGTPFEWETGTGRYYIALSAMFIGGEVVDATGQTIHIVSVPAYRYDPTNGMSWSFESVPQYLNPVSGEIARSDDPSTWPSEWPDKLSDSTDPGWAGSWNGLLGKNMFIDGTEYYYHYSDDLYSRYNFFPDPSDSTRRGLGIVVSERVLEFRDPILEDAVIVVSDIYNVGALDIKNAAATIWVADFVGGDGDSQDDLATYDLGERLVYFNDHDGLSSNPAFQDVRVGTPTLVFVQTPNSLGITNLQYLYSGTINFLTTPDSYFWESFMIPGSFFDPLTIPFPGEFDLFASSGFFPMPAGSSQRLVTGYVFSQDSVEGKRKAGYLKSFVAGGYSSHAYNVSIMSPIPGEMISGSVEIQWNADNNNTDLLIDILYSADFGENWVPFRVNASNNGSFIWSPDSLDDGVLYELQIVAHGNNGLGFTVMDSSFTINHDPPASPQIIIRYPIEGIGYQQEIPVQWFAGDPDGNLVHVDLSYRNSTFAGWTSIDSGLTNSGLFTWDISDLPNARTYWLRALVTDGQMQGMDSVGVFRLENIRYGIPDSAVVLRSTLGTGLIEPRIVDSTQLTGHRYHLEFTVTPENLTTYDVIDEVTGLNVVNNATEVGGNLEGPLFDGIRMYVQNDQLAINDSISAWTRPDVFHYKFNLWHFGFEYGVPGYGDYLVVIDTVGVDTSRTIMIGQATFPSKPVNFTIINTTNGEQVPFGFAEVDGSDGHFTARVGMPFNLSDVIVLLTQVSLDSLTNSWTISLDPLLGSSNPSTGDSLQLFLFKPFTTGDQYVFDAILGPMLGVREQIPVLFSLSQNYPNPFNPSTEIRFSLGQSKMTTLEVYDILGRKVRTLVNEFYQAGEHKVVWDGKNDVGAQVATGVYIYRLIAGSFVKTNKMVLLR